MNKSWLLLVLFFSYQHSIAQYWMQRGGGNTIDEGMDIATDVEQHFQKI